MSNLIINIKQLKDLIVKLRKEILKLVNYNTLNCIK